LFDQSVIFFVGQLTSRPAPLIHVAATEHDAGYVPAVPDSAHLIETEKQFMRQGCGSALHVKLRVCDPGILSLQRMQQSHVTLTHLPLVHLSASSEPVALERGGNSRPQPPLIQKVS
jgi:hypothetical protein